LSIAEAEEIKQLRERFAELADLTNPLHQEYELELVLFVKSFTLLFLAKS